MTERPITPKDLAKMLTDHFVGEVKFKGQIQAQKEGRLFYSEQGEFALGSLRIPDETNPNGNYILYKDKSGTQFFGFGLGKNKVRTIGEGRSERISTKIEYPTKALLQIDFIENLRLSGE